jgi:hypothetical protein
MLTDNQPGPYTGIDISRFFSSVWEAGAGVSYSFLKGHTDTPDFSAIGYQYYMDERPGGPVSYHSRLYGPELFVRYHFGRNGQHPGSMRFFMKAGAGILFYESELFYAERTGDEIIFGKGIGKHKQHEVSNGVFILGGGLNYVLSKRVNLKFAANFNMVGYDFLDNVHNFDSDGNRQEVIGLFTDLTAGVVVKLGGNSKSTVTERAKIFAGPHLPFSPL